VIAELLSLDEMTMLGPMRRFAGRAADAAIRPMSDTEVKMPSAAIPTIQTETDEVRVTRWRLPPGSATGHHRHEFDYVVVPMTDGTLTLVSAVGTNEGRLNAGQAYFRKAGVEHDVLNRTAAEIVFVEIEIKPPA
jgi:quercetin dioxygenase-like cupin family protein